MLIVTAKDRWELIGHGHANAAPPGRDIVCAAASSLLDCYAARLQALRLPLHLRDGPGLLAISPRRVPWRLRREVAAARRTVLTGLDRLAKAYPDKVRVLIDW